MKTHPRLRGDLQITEDYRISKETRTALSLLSKICLADIGRRESVWPHLYVRFEIGIEFRITGPSGWKRS